MVSLSFYLVVVLVICDDALLEVVDIYDVIFVTFLIRMHLVRVVVLLFFVQLIILNFFIMNSLYQS